MTPETRTPNETLRRRRLRLSAPHPPPRGVDATIEGLIALQQSSDGRRVSLTYDVRSTSLKTLVEALRKTGVAIADDCRTRLRVAWQSYLDRNARANLALPGSPCCSNPTSVYASRRRR